jgi:hypothetical protein
VLPEVVTLGVGIVNMGLARAQHLFQHGPILQRGAAQLGPIVALTAVDHIINRSKGELLMVHVPVQHDLLDFFLRAFIENSAAI